jgi:acyl carrier protein
MEEVRDYIIAEIEKITFRKVGVSDSLIQSRLLDSIGLVDLLVAFEEKFGVNIPTSDIHPDNFDTVARIMDYLSKKINNGNT